MKININILKQNIKNVNLFIWISFLIIFLFIFFLLYIFISLQTQSGIFINIFGYKVYWEDKNPAFNNIQETMFFILQDNINNLKSGYEIAFYHPNHLNRIEFGKIENVDYNNYIIKLDNKNSVENNVYTIEYESVLGTVKYKSKFIYSLFKFITNPLFFILFIILPIFSLLILLFFICIGKSEFKLLFYKFISLNKLDKCDIKNFNDIQADFYYDKNLNIKNNNNLVKENLYMDSKLKNLIGQNKR